MAEHLRDTLETHDWEEILSWQRAQLPGFVARLRERSPFYAERLAEADADLDGAGWARVPFTVKDDIRRTQRERGPEDPLLGPMQGVPDEEIAQVIGSSGTTGNPTFFGLTARDLDTWRDSLANWLAIAGVGPGNIVALTTGIPMVAGGMPYADAVRAVGATLAWIGGQPTERQAQLMDLLRVDVLMGTASFVGFFAERCAEVLGKPAPRLHVRTILAGGEPGIGNPETRRRTLEAWGAERISEVMGMCDVMAGMWAQCGQGDGMHFAASRNVHVELIDPETREPLAWADGVEGEAVYTTFTREATPVVRYRSRDHVKVLGMECACGRRTPRIACIGRTDDMLIYKAMNVFPSDIRDVILGHSGHIVERLRIRKASPDQVRFDDPIPVEIETGANVGDELAAELAEAVRRLLRVRVAIEWLPLGAIPVSSYKNALTYVPEPVTA
ncbi:phenylacetate--CoA ligase family protein [Microbacterium album]|uniref:Phenylacetate--CoA ligase n=1 Tax=Microbacterium album TaxID=2053191 RepID=A0A917IEG1_9MICO|nr:hypothetical protein [Microbacterium album]GGH40693.1 phenylacetate--CoA ligase [Microbacterium album]